MSVGRRPHREVRRVLPLLGEPFQGFALRGIWLLHAPAEEVLYGFLFDQRPGHGATRWLSAFGIPLSVPTDHVGLGFGRRIPDGSARGHDAFPVGIGTEEELRETARVMETEGLEELAKWRGVEAFRRTLAQPRRVFNSYVCEAAAVLAARQGDLNAALMEISVFESYIDALDSRDLPAMRAFNERASLDSTWVDEWQRPMLARLRALREPCLAGDHAAVTALLDEWRHYTISKLGIEDICEPR